MDFIRETSPLLNSPCDGLILSVAIENVKMCTKISILLLTCGVIGVIIISLIYHLIYNLIIMLINIVINDVNLQSYYRVVVT